jgi:hypothetical protein
MARTNQLFAHYAALQTDAQLDAVFMYFRRWAELHIEAFWERYPQCNREPRRLNAAGQAAHDRLVVLLRARRECVYSAVVAALTDSTADDDFSSPFSMN